MHPSLPISEIGVGGKGVVFLAVLQTPQLMDVLKAQGLHFISAPIVRDMASLLKQYKTYILGAYTI